MTELTTILEKFLDRLRKGNPYGMVLKGGTALAVHHLDRHRESEDLDFDVSILLMERYEDIVRFIELVFEELAIEGVIKGFEIGKKGFASTDRYHIKVNVTTHRDYQTKIDLDFVELTGRIEKEGELGFYTAERMFVTKLLTFASRMEFKDFYDVAHLVKKVEPANFERPDKAAGLIERVIALVDRTELARRYSRSFANVDLRFRNLRERDVGPFIERTLRDLRQFRNRLLKV
jgi:predicted nucleotidyltransferase component of viral defense system